MSFSINSTSSSREILFSGHRDEYFQIYIKGDVSAFVDVWAYTDAKGLYSFFQELANREKPWHGSKSWESIEGEFTISTTCSPLGEVLFTIQLRGLQGAPEEWKVSVGLATELGQLTSIAKQAREFFCEPST